MLLLNSILTVSSSFPITNKEGVCVCVCVCVCGGGRWGGEWAGGGGQNNMLYMCRLVELFYRSIYISQN